MSESAVKNKTNDFRMIWYNKIKFDKKVFPSAIPQAWMLTTAVTWFGSYSILDFKEKSVKVSTTNTRDVTTIPRALRKVGTMLNFIDKQTWAKVPARLSQLCHFWIEYTIIGGANPRLGFIKPGVNKPATALELKKLKAPHKKFTFGYRYDFINNAECCKKAKLRKQPCRKGRAPIEEILTTPWGTFNQSSKSPVVVS